MILTILATSTISFAALAENEATPTSGTAAPVAAPAATPEPSPAPPPVAARPVDSSRIQVGVAFLPMLLGEGTVTSPQFSGSVTGDLKFAYGFVLTAGYVVVAGLCVGIAPQLILNVLGRNTPGDSSTEIDLSARIAYAYHVIPRLAVYAEVLPGYSIFSVPRLANGQGAPQGFVVAAGAGAAYDFTDMFFANLGIGYQMGFQSSSFGGKSYEDYTRFLRIAVGGGMKF